MTRASIALDASALRASCASARARERWTTTRAGTTTRATSSSGRYAGRGSLASVSAYGRARVVAAVVETSRSGGVGRSRRSRRLGRRRGRERGVARALDARQVAGGGRGAGRSLGVVGGRLAALRPERGTVSGILKRLNDAESATGEMRRAFATLLLFRVVSIRGRRHADATGSVEQHRRAALFDSERHQSDKFEDFTRVSRREHGARGDVDASRRGTSRKVVGRSPEWVY